MSLTRVGLACLLPISSGSHKCTVISLLRTHAFPSLHPLDLCGAGVCVPLPISLFAVSHHLHTVMVSSTGIKTQVDLVGANPGRFVGTL